MIHLTTKNDAGAPTLPRYSIKTLLLTIAVLAIALVLLLKFLQFNRDADIRRIFGGSAGLATLRYADRVEAYRIGKIADKIYWQDAGLSDYPTLKGPVLVSQSDAQTLLATLQDRHTYLWNARKACIIQPGVRLDFIHGDDRLSVLLCFECEIVTTFLNGEIVGGGNFDNARPALVRAVRSLFPNDPKIQSLTEQR